MASNPVTSALEDFRKKSNQDLQKMLKISQAAKETHQTITKTNAALNDQARRLDKEFDRVAKELKVSKDAVADVTKALVNLKVVPGYMEAVTKYQKILNQGIKDYSQAINEGYDDATKFFNANKKEYKESVDNSKKLITELEKRISAGEKLTKSEEKKLNLARKEVAELKPLLDTYRKERKEIDSSVKAKEADARASQKKATETKKAAEKGKAATKDEIKINKQLSQSLKTVLDDVSKIRSALNSGGGLKIQINNAGFTRVLNEMVEAIDRFHERSESGKPRKKNFFDRMFGSAEENKKSGEDLEKTAKQTITQVKNDFIDPLGSNLTEKISKAVSKGIRQGVNEGILSLNNLNPQNAMLSDLANNMGISQFQKQRLISNILGKKDPTAIEQTQIIENRKLKQHQYDRRNENNLELSKYKAELEFERNTAPREVNARIAAKARKEEAAADLEVLRLQKEINKEKRAEYNREINERERVRVEKEMAAVYGDEGSKIKKLGEDLVTLQAKRRQIMIQSEELNKLNFAELANNTRRIQDTTRKWAAEMWNIRHDTESVASRLKTMQTVYTRLASLTQTMSAAISAASGLFSNMRTAATSFFRYFTNGFRRAFAYVRNLATSTLRAGYEQREKIEQAQIGFAAFFGGENVDAVTRRIRTEAAKTPIVDAGSLASYVQQLAPVSKGNASLAINASLGILKSLVYSGSDISEGEYVIKNIRDVIAKGKATAIDIRQFNRALPGLEQALKESGQTGFIDKEGKLNITKANVGQVLDLFAKLNTEENSPLKNIEEAQLKTLSGLKQLFSEKKTTAMETIMEKSGFFDMVKDLFGLANDTNKWDEISNMFGNIIKPVVTKVHEFINGINWNELGHRIRSFFRVIWEGVTEAKNTIMGSLGNAFGGNTEAIMTRLAKIIKQFIIGFGEGVRDVIDFATDITKKLAGTNLEGFVEKIGKYLVSPLGKLIQMMLGFAQNGMGALSRVFANIASMSKGFSDLWKWATDKSATSFANRVVSNLRVQDMTAAQLQQLMLGKAVTANGKDVVASGGVSTLGVESLQAATFMSKCKDAIGRATTAFAKFAVKLGSAVVAGGTIYMFTAGLSTLIRSLNKEDIALQNTADAVEVLGTTITGGVAGGMAGGITGGVIGALLGATVAILKLKAAANAAADEVYNQQRNTTLDKQREAIRAGVLDILKAQGMNVDVESDDGWYANEKLKQWLATQDPSTIDYRDAAMQYAEALRFKRIQKQLYDFANSDEFNNGRGGIVIDPSLQSSLRDSLGEIIRYFRLNGDYYNYTSAESILRDFMNGDTITEDQAKALISLKEELEKTESTMTTDIAGTVARNIKDLENQTKEGVKTVNDMTGTAVETLRKTNELVEKLNAELEPIAKQYEERYGGLKSDNVFSWLGSSVNTLLKSISSGHGLDTSGYIHDRNAFDPTAAGYGNIATLFDDDKEYNIYPQDIIDAMQKWASENSDKIYVGGGGPNTTYGLQQAMDAIKPGGEFNGGAGKVDTIGWINKYRKDYPWIDEYLKKVILHKQFGGLIGPIYRAMGGLGVGVDSVPAMLQPGEFVVRKASVDKMGLSTMFALNRGDMVAAARSLGTRFSNSYNNSKNWSSIVNNNQKTQSNYIKIFNRTKSARVGSYYSLANRIALA